MLVAAHCVESFRVEQLAILAGVHNTNDAIFLSSFYRVETVIIHENRDSSGDDIALIKLKTPVVLSDKVGLICLPSRNSGNILGKNVVAAGWYVFEIKMFYKTLIDTPVNQSYLTQ